MNWRYINKILIFSQAIHAIAFLEQLPTFSRDFSGGGYLDVLVGYNDTRTLDLYWNQLECELAYLNMVL